MLTLRESYTNMKGVGQMHSGGMTTKVEGKEKQRTNRALEDTTLDRAREQRWLSTAVTIVRPGR